MAVKLKKNRIVLIALLAFTVYVIISLVFVNNDIQTRQAENTQLKSDMEKQQILNKELQEILDKGDVDEEYIIKIAREKLNFVFPDERVFKDMIGN